MCVNGKLVSAYLKTSKKGTKCLFIDIESDFTPEEIKDGASGIKVVKGMAFGAEAVSLSGKAYELVNEEVEVLGSFSNNSFWVVSIS